MRNNGEQDIMVGAVLDELRAQTIEENTIVFFSGDNGPDVCYCRPAIRTLCPFDSMAVSASSDTTCNTMPL